jgi:hypothetical protein
MEEALRLGTSFCLLLTRLRTSADHGYTLFHRAAEKMACIELLKQLVPLSLLLFHYSSSIKC